MFRMPLRHSLLAALAAAAFAAPASGFGIGLQPTTVEMEVEPGERQRQVVNIGNVHQERTISLTLGLADWSLDENGQILLNPPGESARSAAEWVRFSPAFVTLEPGESAQVIVDIAPPARLEASGDFRFALLASTVLPEKRDAGAGVWRKYRLASLFYLTAGDAKSAPEIASASLAVGEDGAPSVGLRIENSGNAHARLNGELQVSTRSGGTERLPISNLVVLDEAARNYQLAIPHPVEDVSGLRVYLTNTFAPQVEGAVIELPAHDIPLPEGAVRGGLQ